MGFFENLGRKVGQFTHEAKEAAADEAGYVCEDCGTQFYTEQACPECGSENVTEREETADAGGDGPETQDAVEADDTAESTERGEPPETTESNDAADVDGEPKRE
ncbi:MULTISPECIES: zinc ribbon domain-containing protein [Natrialbaceae]|uniref:zinc ribbon domain-containing protein n=1 Tax=Natrialbaceae TaxID=1644061 RepID=UPI00207CD36F|nr:zinc ribbon domain-containing protein [Natronococcus sp. CG52]